LNTVSLNIGEHLYIVRNSTLHGGTIQFSTGAFEMHTGSTLHVDDCNLLFNDVVLSYEHDATFELNDENALVDVKQPCNITIGNGEIFPVIKGSATTGGTLLLNKGDFNLNNSGRINNNHCKIKLKEYNFHYYEDAEITLTGEEANLEFGNFIYLHPNADFHFNGNGYFGFRLSPNWGIYTNVFGDASNTIDIVGSGPTDKIMEVYNNALNTSDEISNFTIKDGLVLLENNGSIGIGNPYELSNLEISSTTLGDGIYVGGQTNHLINNVTFRNQNNPFRGYLFWTDGAALSMNNCHVYDCYNGITIYDKSFYISNSTFYNIYNSCIAGSIMNWPSIVYNSSFNECSYGLDYSSSGLSSLYSIYNNFGAEATAFRYSGNNMLSAKCNEAHSYWTAKLDQYATLNTSSLIPPAGYNDFQAIGHPPASPLPLPSNFECIQCKQLLIDNGFNSFATGNNNLTFSGHVENNLQSVIVADKNYWHLGSSINPNSPVNYNLKRGNVGDPPKSILLTDQMPMQGECGILSDIISNEFSSPLLHCPVCPDVNGDYFTNVPLNEAIRQALLVTELGSDDSTGNDTLALAMLDEILNTSIHYDNEVINYLHAIAYVKTKETLANAVKNGKVEKDLNNLYIDKMIILESLMIDKENQKDNDIGEFYLTLDLAGTYRLIDDRSKALTVLQDLSVCLELNESQFLFYRKIVNQYTAEKMVVDGLLPIEEFESFLENASRNELNLLSPRANIDSVIINSAPYNGVASTNLISDTESNTYTLSTLLGNAMDYHLTKSNIANNIIWERFYDGWNNGIDSAVAITMDVNEFIYVTGKSWNGFDYDIATVKYDTAGIKYWTAIYNDEETGNDVPHSIEIDSSFKIKIIASSYNDTTTIYKTIYYSQCDTNCIPSNRTSAQHFVNPKQYNFTFSISPNPSDGVFKITILDNGNNHQYQMLLYDISGRLMADQAISNGQNMDFSKYSKGLYFVNIKNGLSGIIEKSKIIIQ
jgi:Secretion system C-terminal sorting domain